MIPRLKPFLGREELFAALNPSRDAVPQFEASFARKFDVSAAIAFSYGRSALRAFFDAVGVKDSEVIVPAYTCSVVAHAVVLSGNVPRFVDSNLDDYNMSLDAVARAINAKTRAILATHLFGYPLDVDRLEAIVADAEARFGQKIWIIQDCAHSFGARWNGRLVSSRRDVALYGLNVSKMITSIFGGMLTTDDTDLAARIRDARARLQTPPAFGRSLLRRAYLFAARAAFSDGVYGIVKWLNDNTPALDRLTRAYHQDEKIHFPPDASAPMLAVEAAVGLVQLAKYDTIIARRKETAAFYADALRDVANCVLPPLRDGATYSHYTIRVPDRDAVVAAATRKGVELGTVIDYSVPHLRPYAPYTNDEEFPNALLCSRSAINLPVHADLTDAQRHHVVETFKNAVS
ncbi:MAG TPA: DegT/DnrJ/EryC1/StrS family aminotransferase [Thermoanaerobaculia bacterium]|nr:DegT/DnrJ/EryC1/StrS family aminotransferase [Thermoanaerobaculia bacterium]